MEPPFAYRNVMFFPLVGFKRNSSLLDVFFCLDQMEGWVLDWVVSCGSGFPTCFSHLRVGDFLWVSSVPFFSILKPMIRCPGPI